MLMEGVHFSLLVGEGISPLEYPSVWVRVLLVNRSGAVSPDFFSFN